MEDGLELILCGVLCYIAGAIYLWFSETNKNNE